MLAQSLCHLPPPCSFWRPQNPQSSAKIWVPFAWGGGTRAGKKGRDVGLQVQGWR